MDFDIAFGCYNEIPPEFGSVAAERHTSFRKINPTTKSVGNLIFVKWTNSETINQQINLEIEKCNEEIFKFHDY